VKEFLNDYMKKKTKTFNNKNALLNLFTKTFSIIDNLLPNGIVRGNRTNITPLILFEAITIGVADTIIQGNEARITTEKLQHLLNDAELKRLTTGATNSRAKVNDRIRYVNNHLTNAI